jgi:mevalonate kinase
LKGGIDETQELTGEGGAKLILFGEHSVVYGKPAIVAGTGVGATATLHVASSPRLIATSGVTGERYGTVEPSGDEPMSRAFSGMLGLFDVESVEANVVLHVPIGAGMGSSAALAVALARALAAFTGASSERIEEAVELSERVFHGSPSGIDQAAAMHGGVFRFRRDASPAIEPLDVGELHLLVCQASPGQSTSKMVGRVRALHEQFGTIADELDNTIGGIVEHALGALESEDWPTVGALMNLNHGLLAALGVSSEALDAACHTARAAGAWGAKLTGAGGGGCVVAIAEDADAVLEAWSARGWTPFEFRIRSATAT